MLNTRHTSMLCTLLWFVIGMVLPCAALWSQSISTLGIDATAFPTMRASFYAFNAQGDQQRPTAAELSITENGQPRTITSVNCSPPATPKSISSVLVVDVSGSMIHGFGGDPHIDLAKAAARTWVNGLPPGISECAITSFDDANYLNQDFTSDSVKLQTAIDGLMPNGGTDYGVAFIEPAAGGLLVSRNGKYRRVIVMLTDGQPNADPDVAAIVSEAHRQACVIYCVALGMRAPQSLRDISAQTGGMVFQNVTTLEQIETIYRQILLAAQDVAPCTVEWETNMPCEVVQTQVELNWQGTVSDMRYDPPSNEVVQLMFSPTTWHFRNPPVGASATRNVTVTARSAPFVVRNITSSNRMYSIAPSSFALQPNESITLTLTHTAADSGYTFCRFVFESDLCDQIFTVSAGHPGRKPAVPTLRLTYPNGGETCVVGSDVEIRWEGVPASDLVELHYSTDDGATWRFIDTARGLRYRWVTARHRGTNLCRFRVNHVGRNTHSRSTHLQELFSIPSNTSVPSLAYSPNGDFIAWGLDDGSVVMADPYTGRVSKSLRIHDNEVMSVAFSPDGSMVASGERYGVVRVWDPYSGSELWATASRHGFVTSVAWRPDGKALAVAYYGTTVILDSESGRLIQEVPGPIRRGYSVAYSPDGAILAIACEGHTELRDTRTYEMLRILPGRYGCQGMSAAFSPDGTMLAVAGVCSDTALWDTRTWKPIEWANGPKGGYYSAAFSPDGSTLAMGGFGGGGVRFWDTRLGERVAWFDLPIILTCVEYSPDGSLLAVSGPDKVSLLSVGSAEVQSDESDGVVSIVEPIATSFDVELGACVVGDYTDSVIIGLVRNLGVYPFDVRGVTFVGADAAAFHLVSGLPDYTVPAGRAMHGEIRFAPTRAGLHQAQIVIATQSDTLVQNVSGIGVSPSLSIVNKRIDFGRVIAGSRKDTLGVATIRNVGSSPLSITQVRQAGPNAVDFTTMAGGGSFVLQPGATHLMDLRYMASIAGRTSSALEFHHDGAGSPAVLHVYAQCVDTLRTTVAMPDIAAFAGTSISVPLYLAAHAGLDYPESPRAFTATIAVDPTMMHLSDPSLVCTLTDASRCEYTVGGVRETGDTLAVLTFVATYGATSHAPLEVVSFRWLDTLLPVVVSTQNGSITIIDNCDEVGARLIVPGTVGYCLSSRPNPVSNSVEFRFILAETGPVVIDIFDQAGRLVLTALDESSVPAGVHTRTIDVRALKTGFYLVALRSLGATLRTRMDVMR